MWTIGAEFQDDGVAYVTLKGARGSIDVVTGDSPYAMTVLEYITQALNHYETLPSPTASDEDNWRGASDETDAVTSETWREDPDNQVACDTCNKLVHKWTTRDGFISCENCFKLL